MWKCAVILHNMIIRDETTPDDEIEDQTYLDDNAANGIGRVPCTRARLDAFTGLINAYRMRAIPL